MDKKWTFFSATKVIKVSKLLINSFNIFRSKVSNFLLCQYRPDFTVMIVIFLPSYSQKKHHLCLHWSKIWLLFQVRHVEFWLDSIVCKYPNQSPDWPLYASSFEHWSVLHCSICWNMTCATMLYEIWEFLQFSSLRVLLAKVVPPWYFWPTSWIFANSSSTNNC